MSERLADAGPRSGIGLRYRQAVAVVEGGEGAGGEELVARGDGDRAPALSVEGGGRGDGLGEPADDGVDPVAEATAGKNTWLTFRPAAAPNPMKL